MSVQGSRADCLKNLIIENVKREMPAAMAVICSIFQGKWTFMSLHKDCISEAANVACEFKVKQAFALEAHGQSKYLLIDISKA